MWSATDWYGKDRENHTYHAQCDPHYCASMVLPNNKTHVIVTRLPVEGELKRVEESRRQFQASNASCRETMRWYGNTGNSLAEMHTHLRPKLDSPGNHSHSSLLLRTNCWKRWLFVCPPCLWGCSFECPLHLEGHGYSTDVPGLVGEPLMQTVERKFVSWCDESVTVALVRFD